MWREKEERKETKQHTIQEESHSILMWPLTAYLKATQKVLTRLSSIKKFGKALHTPTKEGNCYSSIVWDNGLANMLNRPFFFLFASIKNTLLKMFSIWLHTLSNPVTFKMYYQMRYPWDTLHSSLHNTHALQTVWQGTSLAKKLNARNAWLLCTLCNKLCCSFLRGYFLHSHAQKYTYMHTTLAIRFVDGK